MESSSSETEITRRNGTRHRTVLRNSDIESSDSSNHPKRTTAIQRSTTVQNSARLRLARKETRLSTKQQIVNLRETVSSSSSSTMVETTTEEQEFSDRKGKEKELDQDSTEIILPRPRDSTQLNSYITSKISPQETPKSVNIIPKTFRNSYTTPQPTMKPYQPSTAITTSLIQPSNTLQPPISDPPVLSNHAKRVHEVFNRLITGPNGVLSQVNAKNQRVLASLAPPTPVSNYELPPTLGRKVPETVKRDRDSLRKRWEELGRREELSREDTFNQGSGGLPQDSNSAFNAGTPVAKYQRREIVELEVSEEEVEVVEESIEESIEMEESSEDDNYPNRYQSQQYSTPLTSTPHAYGSKFLKRSENQTIPPLSHSLGSSGSTIQNSRRKFELEAIDLEQQRVQMEIEIQEAEEIRLAEELASEEEYQREQEDIYKAELEEREEMEMEQQGLEEDRRKLRQSLSVLRESPAASPPRSTLAPLSSTPRSIAPSPFNSGSKLENASRIQDYLSISTSRLLDTTAPAGLEDDTYDSEEGNSLQYGLEEEGLEQIEEVEELATEEGTGEYHGDDSSSSMSGEEEVVPAPSISQRFQDSPRSLFGSRAQSREPSFVRAPSEDSFSLPPLSHSFNQDSLPPQSRSQIDPPAPLPSPTTSNRSAHSRSRTPSDRATSPLPPLFQPSPPPKLSYSTRPSPRSTSIQATPPPSNITRVTPIRDSPRIESFSIMANRRKNVNLDYLGERSAVRFAMVDSPTSIPAPSPIRVGLTRISPTFSPSISPNQESLPNSVYPSSPASTSRLATASDLPSTPKKSKSPKRETELLITPAMEESDPSELPSLPPTPIISTPSPSPVRTRLAKRVSISPDLIEFEGPNIAEPIARESDIISTPLPRQELASVQSVEAKSDILAPVKTSSNLESISSTIVPSVRVAESDSILESRMKDLEKRFGDILFNNSIPTSLKNYKFLSSQTSWFLIGQIILLYLAIRFTKTSPPLARNVYATPLDWKIDDITKRVFELEGEGIWNWVLGKFSEGMITL